MNLKKVLIFLCVMLPMSYNAKLAKHNKHNKHSHSKAKMVNSSQSNDQNQIQNQTIQTNQNLNQSVSQTSPNKTDASNKLKPQEEPQQESNSSETDAGTDLMTMEETLISDDFKNLQQDALPLNSISIDSNNWIGFDINKYLNTTLLRTKKLYFQFQNSQQFAQNSTSSFFKIFFFVVLVLVVLANANYIIQSLRNISIECDRAIRQFYLILKHGPKYFRLNNQTMRIKGSDEYEALITEENADGSNDTSLMDESYTMSLTSKLTSKSNQNPANAQNNGRNESRYCKYKFQNYFFQNQDTYQKSQINNNTSLIENEIIPVDIDNFLLDLQMDSQIGRLTQYSSKLSEINRNDSDQPGLHDFKADQSLLDEICMDSQNDQKSNFLSSQQLDNNKDQENDLQQHQEVVEVVTDQFPEHSTCNKQNSQDNSTEI